MTRSPTAEPIMMMRPPLFMCFSAACVAASVPRTLMSIMRSISSSVVLERFRNGCARIVHKHIKSAEGRDGLFDRGFDGVGISGVRLNCDRLSASAFNLLDDRRGGVGTFRVCDGHVRSVRGQTLGDCSTNAARTARNECNLSFEFL